MMRINYYKVAGTLIVLFFIASSCSTTKKMALPCPEPASRYHSKTSLNRPRNNKHLRATTQRDSKRNYSFSKLTSLSNKNQNKPVRTSEGLKKKRINPASIQSDGLTAANKIEYKTYLYAALDNSVVPAEEASSPTSLPQDEIADFGNNEAVHDGAYIIPISSELNPKINYLKHSGEMLGFATEPVDTIPGEIAVAPQKTHGLAIAGFAAGVAGFLLMIRLWAIPQSVALFLALLLIGAGGIALSGVALRKIKENPKKYKGKGLASAGVAIGIVFSILWLVVSFVALFVSQIS